MRCKKHRRGLFRLLLCIMLTVLPHPAYAQDYSGSTRLAATVPEQPESEIEAAAGVEKLEDIPLPQGWEWKNTDILLKPGTSVTGIAVYRGQDGSILAERKIIVTAPEQENHKYQPLSGNNGTWNVTDITGTASETGKSTGAKTGDETGVLSWTAVMLLSLGILLAAGMKGRRGRMLWFPNSFRISSPAKGGDDCSYDTK